jgi:hypothetical protein
VVARATKPQVKTTKQIVEERTGQKKKAYVPAGGQLPGTKAPQKRQVETEDSTVRRITDGHPVRMSLLARWPNVLRVYVTLSERRRVATEKKERFDALVTQIAEAVGGKPHTAPVKSMPRAFEKAWYEKERDAHKINDLLRATVEVNDMGADFDKVLAEVQKRFPGATAKRNGYAAGVQPSPSGYRDVFFNVEFEGMVVELQANVKEMIDAKQGPGHTLYEEERKLDVLLNDGVATAEDIRRKELNVEKQKALYNAAFAAYQARLASLKNAASSISTPSNETYATDVARQPDLPQAQAPGTPGTMTATEPSVSKNLEPAGNAGGMSSNGSRLIGSGMASSSTDASSVPQGRPTVVSSTMKRGGVQEGAWHEVKLSDGSTLRLVRLNSTESMGVPGWHDIDAGQYSYLADTKDEAIKTALERRERRGPLASAQIVVPVEDSQVTVIDLFYNAKQPPQKVGGIALIGRWLQARALTALGSPLSLESADHRERIATMMAAEAQAAIKRAGNAQEWYDSTINELMRLATIKHPELADPAQRSVFTLALAITSQTQNVKDNLAYAEKHYAHFKTNGRFLEEGTGPSSRQMRNNFVRANRLIDELGMDNLRRFLITDYKVGELVRYGNAKVSGEMLDTVVKGSAVFGPKIGFGFFSNLNGNFEPVTMDMWFMRLIGRLTGRLTSESLGRLDGQIEEFAETVRASEEVKNGIGMSQFTDVNAADLADDPDALMEFALSVKSAHEKDFKDRRAEYDAGTRVKSPLVRQAESIAKTLKGLIDAPGSGGERMLLRDVVTRAVEKLSAAEGRYIPPAALQALVWYPEQDLYKALGAKLRVTSMDYAEAMRQLLIDEGYDANRLDANRARSGTGAADTGAGGGVREGNGSVVPFQGRERLTAIAGKRIGTAAAVFDRARDAREQASWLTSQAKERGFKDRTIQKQPFKAFDLFAEAQPEAAVEMMQQWRETNPMFSRRTKPDPVKTVTAYKLFRQVEGKLYPLYVNSDEEIPVGAWLDADEGPINAEGKVESDIGELAYRPGWHAGDLPIATHIGEFVEEQREAIAEVTAKRAAAMEARGIDPKDKAARKRINREFPYPKGATKPTYRASDHVWAEVEMAADVDWQAEADKRGTLARDKHITDQIPVDGFYRYKTNANMTGNWLIGGAAKVNRVLSDAEVRSINDAAGVADLPRRPALFSMQTIAAAKNGVQIGTMEVLPKVPAYLRDAGLKEIAPVHIEQVVIEKVLTGKWGQRATLTDAQLFGLTRRLQEPVAVFNDPTDKGSVVVMTDLVVDGEPFVVAIRKSTVTGIFNIEAFDALGRKARGGGTEKRTFYPLKTAYPQDEQSLGPWLRRGALVYFDSKRSQAGLPARIHAKLAAAASMPNARVRRPYEAPPPPRVVTMAGDQFATAPMASMQPAEILNLGTNEPKPGTPFLVARLAVQDELRNANGANLTGLGMFMGQMDDPDAPAPKGFTWKGAAIHLYSVVADKFGQYRTMNEGRGGAAGEVGVARYGKNGDAVWFSFPESGWKAEFIGRVDVDKVRARTGPFDEAGAAAVADAIKAEITAGPLSSRQGPVQGDRFVLPAETRARQFQRLLQDRLNRLTVVQRAVVEQGGRVDEASNVYAAEERMSGRAGARIEKFKERTVQPVLEKMARADIDIGEMGLYMYARHAEERNKWIAAINPAMPDGGSGMMTAVARQYMLDFAKDPRAKMFVEIAADLDKIKMATQRVMVDSGLVTQGAVDGWNARSKYYVSLKGFERLDEWGDKGTGVGRGIDIRGPESRRAYGRESMAGQIVEQIVQGYQRAVVRGEKNRVGKALLNFVLMNPDKALWEVDSHRDQAYFVKNGQVNMHGLLDGEVRYRGQRVTDPERTIVVKHNGQEHAIVINDKLMHDSLAGKGGILNMQPEEANRLIRAMTGFNRQLSKLWTALNPVFTVFNFSRDFMTGMIHSSAEMGAGFAAKVAAGLPGAMKGIHEVERGGTANGEWAKWYEQYKDDGGKFGFYHFGNLEDTQRELDSLLKHARAGAGGGMRGMWERAIKGVKAIEDVVMDYNAVVENAMRVSAYRRAIEAGQTRAAAASLAKNLTVNFNRKGEWTGVLSAAYLFFNPAVQGTARIGQSIKRHPAAMGAMIGGLTTLGVLLGMLGAADLDDEEVPRWDTEVPTYEKAKSLILMTGGGSRVTLPMAYGYGFFVSLGYSLADLSRGKSLTKVGMDLFNSFTTHFSALGDVDNIGTFISPTFFDPIFEIYGNQNAFGGPVMPEGTNMQGVPIPDSQRFWGRTRGTPAHAIAQFLNEASGGNEVQPGWLDISPETIKTFVRYYTGGAGQFVMDTVTSLDTMRTLGAGGPMEKQSIPFLRQLYKANGDRGAEAYFYESRDQALQALAAAKQYYDTDKPAVLERLDREAGLAQLGDAVGKMRKALSGVRAMELDIKADESLTPREREDQLKELEAARLEMVRQWNAEFYREERSTRGVK